jgi:hypothetical protein
MEGKTGAARGITFMLKKFQARQNNKVPQFNTPAPSGRRGVRPNVDADQETVTTHGVDAPVDATPSVS